MRKIISKALISILSITILSMCLIHTDVYASPQTVKKTKTVGFYNNYSQNISRQIYLPQAVNILKVSTNNGNVIVNSFSNQSLNVSLSGGSSSLLLIQNKYSKAISDTRTNSSNSFPATLNYNESGYVGIMNKNGSSFVSSGTLEPSRSKWVRSTKEIKIRNTEYQDYLGLMDVPSTYCGNEAASAAYSSQYASTWNWSCSISQDVTEYYSDAEGYTGTLKQPYDYIIDRSTEFWQYPSGKKGNPTYSNAVYFRTDRTKLEGMVTKPASDTRMYTQNYAGTAYKDGYDTVYDYTVTVEYEEDVLDLSLSQSPTYWTNQDVTITAIADSNYFRNIVLPNGQKVYSKLATYDVATNGIYTFYIEDTLGNTSSRSINITNIDKVKPSASFNPHSSSWTNKDKTVTIMPKDSGGSGVVKWRYRTSPNKGSTYGDWSDYLTTSSSVATLTSSGEHIIDVEVIDLATNVGRSVSGSHQIDKIKPVITTNMVNSDKMRIKVEDTLSGVNLSSIQYVFSNVETATLTSGFLSVANNSEVKIPPDKNYLHVKAKDNAGNEAYEVITLLDVQGSIMPNPAAGGQKLVMDIVTKGNANKIKIVFPPELVKLATVEDPLIFEQNILIEPTHVETVYAWLPLKAQSTIDKNNNRIYPPYKIYIEATNANGAVVNNYMELDVKGTILDNLRYGIKASGYDRNK
ncbi:MAG: hypothetical protein RSA57_03705 [Cetobacterium sp.]|uniref:hypothetical protein n=1 Tax=Bacteria TaxID=2 RepID=UPI002FC820A8